MELQTKFLPFSFLKPYFANISNDDKLIRRFSYSRFSVIDICLDDGGWGDVSGNVAGHIEGVTIGYATTSPDHLLRFALLPVTTITSIVPEPTLGQNRDYNEVLFWEGLIRAVSENISQIYTLYFSLARFIHIKVVQIYNLILGWELILQVQT